MDAQARHEWMDAQARHEWMDAQARHEWMHRGCTGGAQARHEWMHRHVMSGWMHMLWMHRHVMSGWMHRHVMSGCTGGASPFAYHTHVLYGLMSKIGSPRIILTNACIWVPKCTTRLHVLTV